MPYYEVPLKFIAAIYSPDVDESVIVLEYRHFKTDLMTCKIESNSVVSNGILLDETQWRTF